MLELFGTELIGSILIILLFVFIVVGFLVLNNFSKLSKRYKSFIAKLEDTEGLDESLENYLYKVQKIENQFAIFRGEMQSMNTQIKSSIKNIAIVKYNAFEDVTNDLSFVVALLDDNDTGVILNGIYARETSSIFSKEIINGVCSMPMSKEEIEAVKKAKSSKNI